MNEGGNHIVGVTKKVDSGSLVSTIGGMVCGEAQPESKKIRGTGFQHPAA